MTLPEYSDPLAEYVSAFKGRRVLVVGDAIMDEYLTGECSRISPEAPVPVLRVHTVRRVLGGAANTAANVVSLGGAATLVALLGEDDGGATLRTCAAAAGVTLRGVVHGRPTLRKTRVVGQQQQIVRLDYEEVAAPEAAVETALLAEVTVALPSCDIVVISDYAKGVVSERVAQTIIGAAHAVGLEVVVDPRPQHRQYYQGCDYLTPNWKESRALLGLPDAEATAEEAATVGRALSASVDANIVLTLGPHGILFQGRMAGEQFSLPTLAREVFDVSGAGDTVVAAFALARAAGADHATAVTLANRAASVVVGKFGTATVTSDELLAAADSGRLIGRAALAPLAATLRAQGKRIVTTNGSFDLLHAGHLHLLSEAKQRGAVLIVGLNSDASVRGYKGPTRPIVPERQRAALLLALRPVDYVHIFDEPDPIAFLREIAPDVHVNSAEYGRDCVESGTVRQRGGELHLVERLPGLSTSNLVDALQASATTVYPS